MRNLGALISDLSIAVLVGWVIWVVSTTYLRLRRTQAINDFQNRLIERVSSSKDLGEFLETEGGRRFFQAIEEEPKRGRSIDRVLRPLQVGLILTILGISILFLSKVDDSRALVPGVIVFALGLGFLASSSAAHILRDKSD